MADLELNNTNYLKFRLSRAITNLFKNYLLLFDSLEERGYHFGEEDYTFIRKKTLDYGNDAIRDLTAEIEKFEISLKADNISDD